MNESAISKAFFSTVVFLSSDQMMPSLLTSALYLTASLWMMVSVLSVHVLPNPYVLYQWIFLKTMTFRSQMMSSAPRGSGLDQCNTRPDRTTQTLWTVIIAKRDEPLPMTSSQTAGMRLAPTLMEYVLFMSSHCE